MGVVVWTFKASVLETEQGGSLWAWDHPGIHSEIQAYMLSRCYDDDGDGEVVTGTFKKDVT